MEATLPSFQPTASRRVAKIDCYNCVAAKRRCDRSRQQCSVCAANLEECNGYPYQLSWQTGVASRGKLKGKTFNINGHQIAPTTTSVRGFRFKEGRPRQKRSQKQKGSGNGPSIGPRLLQTQTPPTSDGVSSGQPRGQESIVQDLEILSQLHSDEVVVATKRMREDTRDQEKEYFLDSLSPTSAEIFVGLDELIHDNEADDTYPLVPANGHLESRIETMQREGSFCHVSEGHQNKRTPSTSGCDSSLFGQSSTLCGEDLVHEQISPAQSLDFRAREAVEDQWNSPDSYLKLAEGSMLTTCQMFLPQTVHLEQLLNLYDRELCSLPITHDIVANPFRCRQNTSHGTKYLLHAILALSMQHFVRMNDTSDQDPSSQLAVSYKHTAVHLYTSALEMETSTSTLSFIDTALILCTLESLNSAAAPWELHLCNAYRLLENAGGVSKIGNSPRLQAQVAMFLWWDCTVSLVSRSACIFPPEYYETIAEYDAESSWSVFSITGIPKQLFVYLHEIVQLAEEREKTITMKWVTFNMQRVHELETAISQLPGSSASSDELQDEEVIQSELDCSHALKAWKYALLLYIERTFKWNRRDARPSKAIVSFSRLTLDHVRCCRSSSVIQKQLLLPVFLAGSEANDQYARSFSRNYCDTWLKKSRYRMFQDASSLLEEIWSARDITNGSMHVWWGSVIDSKQQRKHASGQATRLQYLFG
ncbi:hypothetical protein A1O1_03379 [Capronia coronata CBS 617.96]|uniref:Zn(2)-C6 fungal-type domain-containing protein n=1 Tax=Capronia coronata CBS 617.96 TaxID=1182541 RepID=W9YKR6_9EURO|nr:uncharacterized protein A1O1_03379 [Capronia coronata CBS 617.96]EXJ90280.1 hypothetical protein A1O1_03379 [Capronia coronata CBS 617.96]